MMNKKIILSMLVLALMLSFVACGGGNDMPADNQETDNQVEEGLAWPSDQMSSLPEPTSKISSIDKLNGTEIIQENDKTTQPTSINVVMNEMTKEEALAYYDKLKNAGFTINTDENDKEKIMVIGELNDADKNPFMFRYGFEDKFGNVSITILKAVYDN